MWWKYAQTLPAPVVTPPAAPAKNLVADLRALTAQLASAAQGIYDSWDQDGDGVDEEYGEGGICDDVADAMIGVIIHAIPDANCQTHYDDSVGHTSVMVARPDPDDDTTGQGATVDISPYVYETGAFYHWKKKPNVTISPQMVAIYPLEYEHASADPY
jgi:hypothetical protein